MPASQNTRVPVGARDGGRVVLEEEVHRGSLGARWRATWTDADDGKRPAMVWSVPLAQLDADEARLLLTASASNVGVHHPAVAEALDVIRVGGELWTVSEHVEGALLASFLETLEQEQDALPVGAVLRIAYDLALAAAAVRRSSASLRSVRLVWSQACVIDTAGALRLTDIAAIDAYARCGAPRRQASLASELAPEQLAGTPQGDPTDVFAIGLVLWQLLAKLPLPLERQPRDGRSHAALPLLASTGRGARLPGSITSLVDRALKPDPRERYGSLAQFVAAFDAVREPPMARGAEVAALLERARRHEASGPIVGASMPRLKASAAHTSNVAPDSVSSLSGTSGTFAVSGTPASPAPGISHPVIHVNPRIKMRRQDSGELKTVYVPQQLPPPERQDQPAASGAATAAPQNAPRLDPHELETVYVPHAQALDMTQEQPATSEPEQVPPMAAARIDPHELETICVPIAEALSTNAHGPPEEDPRARGPRGQKVALNPLPGLGSARTAALDGGGSEGSAVRPGATHLPDPSAPPSVRHQAAASSGAPGSGLLGGLGIGKAGTRLAPLAVPTESGTGVRPIAFGAPALAPPARARVPLPPPPGGPPPKASQGQGASSVGQLPTHGTALGGAAAGSPAEPTSQADARFNAGHPDNEITASFDARQLAATLAASVGSHETKERSTQETHDVIRRRVKAEREALSNTELLAARQVRSSLGPLSEQQRNSISEQETVRPPADALPIPQKVIVSAAPNPSSGRMRAAHGEHSARPRVQSTSAKSAQLSSNSVTHSNPARPGKNSPQRAASNPWAEAKQASEELATPGRSATLRWGASMGLLLAFVGTVATLALRSPSGASSVNASGSDTSGRVGRGGIEAASAKNAPGSQENRASPSATTPPPSVADETSTPAPSQSAESPASDRHATPEPSLSSRTPTVARVVSVSPRPKRYEVPEPLPTRFPSLDAAGKALRDGAPPDPEASASGAAEASGPADDAPVGAPPASDTPASDTPASDTHETDAPAQDSDARAGDTVDQPKNGDEAAPQPPTEASPSPQSLADAGEGAPTDGETATD